MKSIISLLSSLVLITACNSDSEEKKTETIPTTEQKLPKCFIEEGTPKTDSSVVVYVHCTEGNTRINEATLTLNNQVKSLEYKDFAINDYVGFGNLEASKNYTAELEVVVGGEAIKKSVKIETNEEKIEPIAIPKWTQKSYELTIRSLNIPNDNTILDLNTLCSSSHSIHYTIKSVNFTEGALLPMNGNAVLAEIYNLSDELNISNGKLKLKSMPLAGGNGSIIIRAEISGAYSDMEIKIRLQSLYLP